MFVLDRRFVLFVALPLAAFLAGPRHQRISAADLPGPAPQTIDFIRDVQPILRKNCYSCHGAEMQESGLRLDRKQQALEGGDGGRVIVTGKSAESRLIRMVAGLDEDTGIMPPEGEGTPLTESQIAVLRAWIDQGVKWPDNADALPTASDHWSFQPIRRPELPAVHDARWPMNGIDRFVLARLEQEGIRPSPEADRATLIRRLYLDLLGLPPAPGEVNAFVNDHEPDAYERLVDRLLESKHYGERWARHWLDLARYADSDGYEKDRPRPNAWRYRQWVIEALNDDMPFDQFTIEQIAGDLLPEVKTAHRVAVGFHRNTLHNTEGGTDQEEDRVKKTIDRTNTVGTTWLGLTVGCAQCHSHKYDPISHREYYSFYSFFNYMAEQDVAAPTDEERAAFEKAKQAFDAAQAKLTAAVGLHARDATSLRSLLDGLSKDVAAVAKHAQKAPSLGQAQAQSIVQQDRKVRETRIFPRGDFLRKSEGGLVEPAVPAVLPPVQARNAHPDRLDLARWMVDPRNPLTARVTVNRIWQRYFQRGIVATSDDFGTQGERPSHPRLLDWLACELRDNGWRLKHVHRLIVTSQTYRQSSAVRTDLADVDPENILLARQTRSRVEAEVIRDLALAASGLLSRKIGGPSVRPPQPSEYSKLTYANSAKWVTSQGDDAYRRGLYTFFQRTSPYPMLMTFDSPDSNECTARRSTSNTPLQALTLWNDRVFFECAQNFARRVVREAPSAESAGPTIRNRAVYAFQLCLARRPSAEELEAVVALFQAQRELASADVDATTKVVGSKPMPDKINDADLAGWVMVGRALMNLDEFITRE